MQAFTKAVALGSYSEAGRQLGLTRSAVSKAVMELERILGAPGCSTARRQVSPTEAGIAYFERAAEILAQIEETELSVARLHDEPRGDQRINAPMSFGVLNLGAAMADFMTSFPDLRVELTLNDRLIDPIEESFDITVRIANLADSSLIARKLALCRRVVVAAPDYIARSGAPRRRTTSSGIAASTTDIPRRCSAGS